jgi:chromate reductase
MVVCGWQPMRFQGKIGIGRYATKKNAPMIRLLAISGSLRRASVRTALLRAAMHLAPDQVEVILFAGVSALPLFNPDIAHACLPAVDAWHAALVACDGIIIACPEYAHGVPGAFKNALDWAVGKPEIGSKPVALIHASARAVHAQAALAEIVTTMGWLLVPEASPTIPVAGKGSSAAEIAATPALAEALRAAVAALAASARQSAWHRQSSACPEPQAPSRPEFLTQSAHWPTPEY